MGKALILESCGTSSAKSQWLICLFFFVLQECEVSGRRMPAFHSTYCEGSIYSLPELLEPLTVRFQQLGYFQLNLALLKLKFDWLNRTLGAQRISVTLSKKGRGKNPSRQYLQKDPSTAHPPPRPTDDCAGFEPGNSVTSIRAEAFRKEAHSTGPLCFLSNSVNQ